MSFDADMAKLIQKYFSEVRNEQLELDEILSRPRWKRVWAWWKALEHYEGKPPSDLTIEEVKDIYGD